jgi:DNA-binding IclR family transcriptional regulator
VAEKEAKSSIQVIERMMSLLDALAERDTPVNLKLLAARTGLHPSTAHRILGVMVENRFVDRIEPGAYRLGIRLLELGSLVKSRINVRQEALPHMQALHEKLRETVNLSVRNGDEVVYIERAAEATAMRQVIQVIGARAPLHVTAVGKIYLAADHASDVAAYVSRSGLPTYTERTIGDAKMLARQLDDVRRKGYACDDEEAEKGVSCIAAGVLDEEGRLVAGLSVSAPTDRLDRAWSSDVQACAMAISRAIGYRA